MVVFGTSLISDSMVWADSTSTLLVLPSPAATELLTKLQQKQQSGSVEHGVEDTARIGGGTGAGKTVKKTLRDAVSSATAREDHISIDGYQ